MIELENVSKSYGEHQVLEPLSLTIEPGKTAVLIGQSGCGKSTLLRILIGLIPADSGTVRIHGVELNQENLLKTRHSMGYVLQDGGLFPHLTIEQNVGLLARHLQAMPGEQIQARVRELAELTKLSSALLNRYPNQVSGGQRQRVAMMRALMLDPPILLLDEPMGALDPIVRYDLQEDLKQIFTSLQKTVVLVTHDMGEAGFFGDDLMLMHAGVIVQRGTMSDFLESPANEFVSRFITAQRPLMASIPAS
jgi:osmoprotectant transport system ATP-binding protein